ncbi:hypothetical protein BS78_01G314000 [Paspalum vaginatum]|nr:hypothetical protein BS78_01G314000 [Paspalum vaginatum]
MNLLSWNCRGLGRDSAVGELRWLVKQYRPSLLFLSETKMREEKVKRFMWPMGYNGCLAINCQGRGEGLALFWSMEHSVSLQSLCPNFIDVHIKQESGVIWRVTFIYGEPKTEQRHVFWDRMRFLKAQWEGPWVCIGDFNEVLSSEEHMGPTNRGESQMRLFRECLEDCQLMDLGFTGPNYTWNNRQQEDHNIRVRLDRAVANGQFTQLFDDIQVENIITTSSDHFAVHLSISKHRERRYKDLGGRNFRFEAAWCRAPDYLDIVEKSWVEGSVGPRSLQNTWANLKKMAGTLSKWNRESFGSPRKEIKKLEKRLARLRHECTTRSYAQEERDIERRLCELFEREEMMARQRSRVDWLKAGDRNTSFFHARATARRRANRINYLKRQDGSKPYSNEEIREALFQMGPTKAPGPDGFPSFVLPKALDYASG